MLIDPVSRLLHRALPRLSLAASSTRSDLLRAARAARSSFRMRSSSSKLSPGVARRFAWRLGRQKGASHSLQLIHTALRTCQRSRCGC